MRISEQEQARRAEAVRQARHSTEMEGVTTDAMTRADEDAYAAGAIDEGELMRRARARYGLPD